MMKKLRHLPVEHLKIGECIFTNKPVLISTVLGSCVSVTLHHPRTRFSGMFHAMLPDSSERTARSPCIYVDRALTALVERFKIMGVRLLELEVKLFGGANTLRNEERDRLAGVLDVGRKNVEMAQDMLRRMNIPPQVENVRGDMGRKILFDTSTGDVFLQMVEPNLYREILKQARAGA